MTNTIYQPEVRRRHRYNNDFDRAFNEFFFTPERSDRRLQRKRPSFAPANIIKTENGRTIELAVPGYSKSDITISIEENKLYIRGNKEKEERKYFKREFRNDDFERVFYLPDSVDVENIEASTNQGILMVNIPNLPEKSPVTIEVK